VDEVDKLEYSTRLDEIKRYVRQGKQDEALDLLDGTNWRKVHNVNILLKASELYEACGAYEEARELLEVAHERSPIGRMIIYRLALISIELKAIDEAKEYYDEFVEIAPHDSLKYIIKYKLNEAKGSDDQTLIAILEELRAHDLIEEWLFELACLYRKTTQVDKCIEICDEIALWFGDGPYVEKALEMKMLYHPLDKQQED
jgi:tetratricopeptide (TPR) repeat protein